MEYKIAIPSYRRAAMLIQKTIAYLKKCNVTDNRIYVFVANNSEFSLYRNVLSKDINVVLGVETLREQRNFIRNWFQADELILNFDDDVDGLFFAKDKKLELFIDLDKLAQDAYEEMTKHKTKLFGVYPVANHFFMDDRITSSLKYIVGAFWGCINEHDEQLKITIEEKEDYERTIKYYIKYKSVVRFNTICVKTNYYKNPGGMQVRRTMEDHTQATKYLTEMYPQYCKLSSIKRKGFDQLKLIEDSAQFPTQPGKSSIDYLFGL